MGGSDREGSGGAAAPSGTRLLGRVQPGRVVTPSYDDTGPPLEIGPSFPLSSALLAELADFVGGYRLTDRRTLESIEDWPKRIRQLRAYPADTLSRWPLADPWTRTISPSQSLTVPEYIRMMLEHGGARMIDTEFAGHPLVRGVGK